MTITFKTNPLTGTGCEQPIGWECGNEGDVSFVAFSGEAQADASPDETGQTYSGAFSVTREHASAEAAEAFAITHPQDCEGIGAFSAAAGVSSLTLPQATVRARVRTTGATSVTHYSFRGTKRSA